MKYSQFCNMIDSITKRQLAESRFQERRAAFKKANDELSQ